MLALNTCMLRYLFKYFLYNADVTVAMHLKTILSPKTYSDTKLF